MAQDEEENFGEETRKAEAAAAMIAAGVVSALKRSANAKLKEVARGVSAVAAIQAERSHQTQINATEKNLSRTEAGLSPAAEKQLEKEERRQERAFKKQQKENDAGITAVRTESRFVTKDGERTDRNKMMPPKTVGEDKKKADALRHAELTRKIEKLRDKLEKLQRRRIQQIGGADKVQFSEKETKALPSVKAGQAIKEAYKNKELSTAEKVGAVNEESLMKMELSAIKAEEKLNKARLVPDYATPEYKRKVAEREKEREDRQKLLTLSGRSGAEKIWRKEGEPAAEEQRDEKSTLQSSLDKSKKTDEGKSGKDINMQQYQLAKKLRGNQRTN